MADVWTNRLATQFHSKTVLVVGALALILVVTGLPRLAAAVLIETNNATANAVRTGADVDEAAVDDAIDDYELASSLWLVGSDQLVNLGLLKLRKVELLERAAERSTLESRSTLLEAIDDIESGLAKAPLDPEGWYFLSFARWLQEGWGARAREAMEMSVLTGGFEPETTQARVAFGLQHWNELDEAGRKLIAGQMQQMWVWREGKRKWTLMTMVCRYNAVELLRASLGDAPNEMGEFERLYPHHMTPEGCARRLAKDAERRNANGN